jgi:hypothetical protein
MEHTIPQSIKGPKTGLQMAVGAGTHKSLKTTQNAFKSV